MYVTLYVHANAGCWLCNLEVFNELCDEYCTGYLRGTMGLGKRCSTRGNERLGCVRFSRSFGRNRVVISNDMEVDSCFETPMKMHCEGKCGFVEEKSVIESLPQDILVSPG